MELVANPTAFAPKLGQCAKVLTMLRTFLAFAFFVAAVVLFLPYLRARFLWCIRAHAVQFILKAVEVPDEAFRLLISATVQTLVAGWSRNKTKPNNAQTPMPTNHVHINLTANANRCTPTTQACYTGEKSRCVS